MIFINDDEEREEEEKDLLLNFFLASCSIELLSFLASFKLASLLNLTLGKITHDDKMKITSCIKNQKMRVAPEKHDSVKTLELEQEEEFEGDAKK